MVDRPQIQPQMEVYASDGSFVGRVEKVVGQSIRLTAKDSPDLQEHSIPLDWVARVDRHVHLSIAREGLAGIRGGAAPGGGAIPPVAGATAAGAAIGAVAAGAAGHIERPGGPAAAAPPIPPAPPTMPAPRSTAASATSVGPSKAAGSDDAATPLPPIRNPAVPGARPRGNYYLPWVLALLGTILLLFLLLRSCESSDVDQQAEQRTTTGPAEQRAASQASSAAPLVPGLTTGTLAYALNEHLASGTAGERTFAFDRLNFRTGSARLSREDQQDLDDIARVLAAYPAARIAVVGYTDARGDDRSNARLGGDRANAVVGGLAERGVAPNRLEARSGGEAQPLAGNEQEGGRAENRRTELIVLSR